jgi:hypothetical protein
MDTHGQFNAPAALSSERHLIAIGQEARWTAQQVCTLKKRKISAYTRD